MTVLARRPTPPWLNPGCTPRGPHCLCADLHNLQQSPTFFGIGTHISCMASQVQHVLDERKLLLEVRHPFIVTL